ncbi:SGNH/GDSL hydrolase family protein [Sporosarcina jiandibaonis]|uniref:SGNH/GDSL hydrolase family protein n=1 Tax=Sporosarcina jiandibaonis TaxID=2715535 RepID=UPI0015573A72|nr:SGNH/GDSL hydrolase family protein [Sporosarcina jiandibaonis]
MQKVIKQSRALLLILAFLLAFAPMSALAGSGKKKTVNYISLGDSLAAGMLYDGSDSPGFAGDIKNDLKSNGYKVNLRNYGVPGYNSQQVLAGLSDIKKLPDADIITISAGANDVLSGLDVANLDLLIPGKVDELIKFANDTEGAANLATESAKVAIDGAVEPVNTIKDAVLEGKDVVDVVKNAVEQYMEILPSEVQEVLAAIYGEIEISEDRILEASDELINAKAIIFTNPVEAATSLETSTNKLVTAEGKLDSLETNAGILEVFIEESPYPIFEDIKDAVLNVKEKANQAASDATNAKNAVRNAKGAVNLAIDAQIAAQIAVGKAETAKTKAADLTKAVAEMPMKIGEIGTNIAQIIGEIKAVNPNTEIYVMGYYNAMPYLSQEVQQGLTLGLLDKLNNALKLYAEGSGATFIPTFHLFEGQYETYLPNPKNIHPSEAGYRALASGFMGEISQTFPKVESEEPGEVKIDLNEKVSVGAGDSILINDTDVRLLLPTDLPEGTTLTVTPTSDDTLAKAKGLKDVGDVLNFTFEFPEGSEKYDGKFTLVMGYDADESFDVDIYNFAEEKDAWVAKVGKVNKESKEISLEVSHFSNYGVFAKIDVEKENPPATEKPDDDDKTPPVVKEQNKAPGKGNKTTEKPKPKSSTDGKKLPKTATNNFSLLLIGTILLVTGITTLAIRPKKVLS